MCLFHHQPIDELVRKYCIQSDLDPSQIRLQFDGEDVSLDDTPNDLDLEDGYCLDVIHIT